MGPLQCRADDCGGKGGDCWGCMLQWGRSNAERMTNPDNADLGDKIALQWGRSNAERMTGRR